MKKTIANYLLIFVLMVIFPVQILAAPPIPGPISQPTLAGGPCTNGVDTALGCIPTDPKALVEWILTRSIAMGGGLAILLSLWGGVTIILAGGNPEKINEGKEIITSAISGLMFILFSIFLLRFIGVDILGIFTS